MEPHISVLTGVSYICFFVPCLMSEYPMLGNVAASYPALVRVQDARRGGREWMARRAIC